MRCEFCVDVHPQRTLAHGASKQEIAESIAVAMFTAAGSQICWTNVYGKKIYDSIFEEKEPEKP